MDLSKAFYCLPKNLLLAKLHAYGIDRNSLLLIQNYLSNRKQRVKVNGHYSSWGELGQGVPQGLILGPLLFNIFLNDIFYSLTEGSLCNFADYNTISVTATNTDELLQLVKINTKKCLDWFKSNEMIANPFKFQAITIGSKDKCINEFEIDQKFAIKIEKNVTLLGVQIDENLKFDAHIDKICQKAANQLNSLKRLARLMGDREKKIIMNSFILCQFNYCPLIWMLCGKASQDKLEKINERALRLAFSDYSSSYKDLLANSKETTMHVQLLEF